MKYLLIVGVVIASFFSSLESRESPKSDCEFVILIASYNNEKYVEENLRSACWQRSSNPYHVVYVNDCSSDKTKEFVDEYVRDNHLEDRVTVIHNTERRYAMENYYEVIHSLPDHTIVVNLDGDDTFAHDAVLEVLESYYADPDTWLTYGMAEKVPAGGFVSCPISDDVFIQKKVREHKWCSSHLKSYKAGLFKKIKKEDLFLDGVFTRRVADLAYMFPMLEMCAPQATGDKNHSRYVPETLYHYRVDNALSEFRVDLEEVRALNTYFRNKPAYEPLDSL